MVENSMLSQLIRRTEAKKRAKNTLVSIDQTLGRAERHLNKPLEDVDWEELLSYIEEQEYADSSLSLLENKLIQFYKFCYKETHNVKYYDMFEKLKDVRIYAGGNHIHPGDLIMSEDAKRLINVATLERDRCIVATLHESGMRKGEMLALTLADVLMDEKEQKVTFNIPDEEGCKTGGRVVPCFQIYGYVQDWLKCNTSDTKFMPFSPSAIKRALIKLKERAGLTKPCNPHMFRHSAITLAIIRKMPHVAVSERFWGVPNSSMLPTYVHLSEQMVSDAYKESLGMSESSTTVINPLASRCVDCGRLIKSGSLCPQCKLNKELQSKVRLLENKIHELREERNDYLEKSVKEAMEEAMARIEIELKRRGD